MDRLFLALGSLAGFVAVAMGAFGTHALRARLSPDQIRIWETANHYLLAHALALVAVALVATRFARGPWAAAGGCFAVGSLFFSGSLYLLVLTGTRPLGMITPIGGLLLLIGWVLMAVVAWKGTGG